MDDDDTVVAVPNKTGYSRNPRLGVSQSQLLLPTINDNIAVMFCTIHAHYNNNNNNNNDNVKPSQ